MARRIPPPGTPCLRGRGRGERVRRGVSHGASASFHSPVLSDRGGIVRSAFRFRFLELIPGGGRGSSRHGVPIRIHSMAREILLAQTPRNHQPSAASGGRLSPGGSVALNRSRFVRKGLKRYNR